MDCMPSVLQLLPHWCVSCGQVVSAAHAVVLASGTLAPVSSLQQQLFPGLPEQQLCHFSCGHVVSKGQFRVLTECRSANRPA